MLTHRRYASRFAKIRGKEMKDLEWKDEYLVGIPAIDLQHRGIFDNILGIAHGPADDDRLRAEATIIRLPGLLQEHFSLEENMMRTLHYPELERHVAEHRQFHAEVHHLAQTSLTKKGGVSREAIIVAHRWLTDHIMVSDKHYLAFFMNPSRMNGGEKKQGPRFP